MPRAKKRDKAGSGRRGPRTPTRPPEEASLRPIDLMAKARSLSDSEVEEAAALQDIQATNQLYASCEGVVPRYDPESLLRYAEITPHLRPAIDAMAQNIDGFGYHSEPAEPWMTSLDTEEATKAIRQALEIERWYDEQENRLLEEQKSLEREEEIRARIEELRGKAEAAEKAGRTERTVQKWRTALADAEAELDEVSPSGEQPEGTEPVTDEEVEAVRQQLEVELRRQQYLFDAWFRNCCSDRPFVELRRNVREDIKTHGWGCMEFLRDGLGRLKRLSYVPGFTVRPLADRGELIDVMEDDSITPLSDGREVMVKRRFRLYVQIVNGKKIYFKSPGDPRVVSRTTGKVYRSLAEMRRPKDADPPGEGKDAEDANELLYLSEHDPASPCPPPVWIGNLLSVLGGREADETNYFYLADKAIPAGLIFVHGGRVPRGTKDRLESRIKNELAGAQGSGKLLVVEAEPGNKAPSERSVMTSITFQSLREAMTNDATFMGYDERSSDRIGASFRLSPLLRGYTPSSLNRATALAALYFAEQQVFQPERDLFDWKMDKYILPEIGITYLQFVSNSPPTRSAEEVGKLIQATAPSGAWTPNEEREVIGDVLNKPMARIDEQWADQPMVITLAGGAGGPAPEGAAPEMADLGKRLRDIEMRVENIVAEELRAAGYDLEARATFVDPLEEEGE